MSEKWVVAPAEWYPVYEREDDRPPDGEWAREIELTDDEAVFVTQAMADYDRAHEILHRAYTAALIDGTD